MVENAFVFFNFLPLFFFFVDSCYYCTIEYLILESITNTEFQFKMQKSKSTSYLNYVIWIYISIFFDLKALIKFNLYNKPISLMI